MGRPIRYLGLDYSVPSVAIGRRRYPGIALVAGDATALPFQNNSCDVVLSGTVLMHVPDYRKAIAESRRVARHWCIFHTVAIRNDGPTTVLKKRAYGEWTIEIVLNERELCNLIRENGMNVRHVLPSIPYDLKAVIGETTVTKTYVAEVLN